MAKRWVHCYLFLFVIDGKVGLDDILEMIFSEFFLDWTGNVTGCIKAAMIVTELDI